MPLITAFGYVKQKAKKQYVLFWKITSSPSEVLQQDLAICVMCSTGGFDAAAKNLLISNLLW